MPKSFAAVILVALIAAAAYWLFVPHDDMTETPASGPTGAVVETPTTMAPRPVVREDVNGSEAETSTAVTAPADALMDDSIVAPPSALEDSDATVLKAVTSLNPTIAQWLTPNEQIRKWVALINQLSDGKVPVKDRPLEFPLPPFKATREGGTQWLDHSNYRRATNLIKALTQMPPSRVAKHYQAWLPLLERAQDELGNGNKFSERLRATIDRILAVQPLTGDIELQSGVLKFTFASQPREQASDLEKALWRLGPANTLRIQNYLRDLKPLL